MKWVELGASGLLSICKRWVELGASGLLSICMRWVELSDSGLLSKGTAVSSAANIFSKTKLLERLNPYEKGEEFLQ